jgi:DNA polymerase
MGIDVWRANASPDLADGAGDIVLPDADWVALESQVRSCTRCPLHASRTQTVFGVGNPQAEWLIIGEAPGAEEDRLGEPFVGRAGKLLDAMLGAVHLDRNTVYIANILKCRPPNNRDPRSEEAAQCTGYLERQIDLIQPGLILAVGRVAAQRLLGSDEPLGRMRGRRHHFGQTGIPVVVTYHPAYLLRSPREKRKAWEDLQFAISINTGRL